LVLVVFGVETLDGCCGIPDLIDFRVTVSFMLSQTCNRQAKDLNRSHCCLFRPYLFVTLIDDVVAAAELVDFEGAEEGVVAAATITGVLGFAIRDSWR